MNTITGFSSINPQFQRQQVSAGQQSANAPTDSVGSSEPGGLPKRPEFAAAAGPSEGQRSSLGWGRALVYAVALTLTCSGVVGCATVNHTTGKEPPPVAMQAGQAVRNWHENVDKPVGKAATEAVKGWHENVNKPVGHWFRDRVKEFKDGVTGK